MAILPAWRSVVTPHIDILSGGFEQTGFVDDLATVLSPRGRAETIAPEEFFARTYVTTGLHALLSTALGRLTRKDGEHLVTLTGAPGSGKTHTLLALYHFLSPRAEMDDAPASTEILREFQLDSRPTVHVAVLACGDIDPSRPHMDQTGHGLAVRTLWGELAAQLGGPDAYGIVRRADEQGVAPPPKVLIDLLDWHSPCLILIDDLALYARSLAGNPGLPAGSLETVMTFVQSLIEAARRTKRGMVALSLPSDPEVSDVASDKRAIELLQRAIGTPESIWHPAQLSELAPLLRRRIFSGASDNNRVNALCSVYLDYYCEGSAFPVHCRDEEYRQRLIAAYPFHPTVLDHLDGMDQSIRSLMLQLGASVRTLWEQETSEPLIRSSDLPLEEQQVRKHILSSLSPEWEAVLASDIDQPEANRGEGQQPGSIGVDSVARIIFLATATSSRRHGIRDIDRAQVHLALARPGDSVAEIDAAIDAIHDRLGYLYSAGDHFWFDTTASLRPLVRERAQHLGQTDVFREIEQRAREITRDSGEFHTVHWYPDTQKNDVADDQAVCLVILKPEQSYDSASAASAALEAAKSILERCGESPRMYRNTLTFLASDAVAIGVIQQKVRLHLAWKAVWNECDILNLDVQQRNQADDGRRESGESLQVALRDVFTWLLVPYEDQALASSADAPEPQELWWWEPIVVAPTPESCIQRAAERLSTHGRLVTQWSAHDLHAVLARAFWRGTPHVLLQTAWQQLCSRGLYPRLRDVFVFLEAVRAGLESHRYFAYASGVDEDGAYIDLSLGHAVGDVAVRIDADSVLVEPEAAQGQLRAAAAAALAIRHTITAERPKAGTLPPAPTVASPVHLPADPECGSYLLERHLPEAFAVGPAGASAVDRIPLPADPEAPNAEPRQIEIAEPSLESGEIAGPEDGWHFSLEDPAPPAAAADVTVPMHSVEDLPEPIPPVFSLLHDAGEFGPSADFDRLRLDDYPTEAPPPLPVPAFEIETESPALPEATLVNGAAETLPANPVLFGPADIDYREPDAEPASTVASDPFRVPTSYHGTVELNPRNLTEEATTIADDIVTRLMYLDGTTVRVFLRIEADVPQGVSDQVMEDLSTRSQRRNFDSYGFDPD